MNKKLIALSGMRGSGKSTIGKALAAKIGWQFIDQDQWIEEKEGQKIVDIVADNGWQYFRDLEKKALLKLAKKEKVILGLGGGALVDEENYENLSPAFIIFLECDLEVCAERIKECTNRPSLTENPDFIAELKDVWESRKQQYLTRNDLIINNSKDSVDETVDHIIKKITPLLDQ